MKFLNLSFLIISAALLYSCGVKTIPSEAVYLHKGQLELLNGYYELVPYENYYSQDDKDLRQVFDFSTPRLVSYIALEFISDKKLKVSYEIDGISEEKIVEGKRKHGGFYLDKSWGAFDIPLIIWLQWNTGKRIFMGNDDNLILDEFYDSNVMLFGRQNETVKRETFLYDRLYQQIHTSHAQKSLNNHD